MNDDSESDPLAELFRAELRNGVASLSLGLVACDADRGDTATVEEMVAACRTLRGAARLMGHAEVAELLTNLEAFLNEQTTNNPSTRQTIHAVVTLLSPLETMPAHAWVAATESERARWNATLRGVPAPPVPAVVTPSAPIPPPHNSRSTPSVSPPLPPPASSPASAPLPPPDILSEPARPEHPPLIVEARMLELFREEVRSHAAVLSEQLLELEREPGNATRVEPLMRAAHSLKGACRIVGLDSAVGLAHDLEDLFVSVQAGRLTLSGAAIDTFLAATDLLALLGADDPNAWAATHSPRAGELRSRMAAIARGETPPPIHPAWTATAAVAAEPTASPPPSSPSPTSPPSSPPASPALEVAASVSPPESTAPLAPPSPPAPSPSVDQSEAVVRVTAESLTRLMSLAGESLVQARWLQPFASALLELKKLQDQITARLDWTSQEYSTNDWHDNLEEARRLTKRCQQVLIDRIGEFENHAGQAEDLNSRLYREVIVSRMRPFADGTHGFPRLVRDTARSLGKQVRLDITGKDTEVDRDILEKLEAPLTHLLRNAVDHGIEPATIRAATGKLPEGTIRLDARHRGGMLSITIMDDGAGIDIERLRQKVVDRGHSNTAMAARMTEAELLEFLFLPGFSTANQVTEISGRGVGLDVVQDTVRKVGGSVQIKSTLGTGTTFHLMLPLTLSVVRAVLVEVAGDPYAFPHNRIDRLLRVPTSELQSLQHRQYISVDGKSVGLVLASQLFDIPVQAPPAGGELPIVLLSDATGSYGLVVDAIRGEQDLVVRPLDPRLGKVPNVGSAAILDDGSPVLIADVEDLIRSMDQFIQSGTLRRFDPGAHRAKVKKRVLVVDDSITVREVQRQILRGRGYEVEIAVDGADGWNKLRSAPFDLVVSDVDMPRMTGLELVRRIRDDAKYRELPVVIVSYKDREEDRLRGLEAGANHYLIKSSFHDDSFVEVVAGLIGE
ncbi:MAG: hybrid sensor histidine kinase/response regulator [Bacteroidales bacterium]|nr:hybrid sensor histidine kinase/response regulator [Bacteroidales bacterium]